MLPLTYNERLELFRKSWEEYWAGDLLAMGHEAAIAFLDAHPDFVTVRMYPSDREGNSTAGFIGVHHSPEGSSYHLMLGNEETVARDDQGLAILEGYLFKWMVSESMMIFKRPAPEHGPIHSRPDCLDFRA